MKTNLENFPKLNEELPMKTRLKDYWYKSQSWKGNIEKELRELEIPVVPKPSEEYQKGVDNALAYTKREILGEEP